MKTRLILLCAALLLAVSAYAENPVSLPANLTVIEEEAFEGLNVGTVVLPEGTTTIGSRAFADCAELTIVHMPDSVESIADNAFAGCENLAFICASENVAAMYAAEHGIPYVIVQ